MAPYRQLKDRLDNGDVILLDGAVGTQLQDMGVPMHPVGWCAPANLTHPGTVELMHERYIKAGTDVITTNTFSTIRPKMEGFGYGDRVQETNIQAVRSARRARDRTSGDRSVWIAGSMSNHFGHLDIYSGVVGSRSQTGRYTSAEIRAYYVEVADILAEAGVDLFLIENMGADNEARLLAAEAAKNTGLPVWVSVTASMDSSDETVLLRYYRELFWWGSPLLSAENREIDYDLTLADAIKDIAPLDPDVICVMHSGFTDTTAALDVLREEWSGPVGAYPDAGRQDYLDSWQDRTVSNEESVNQFTDETRKWVDMGVQVIGACCGLGVDYIRPLRDALPDRVPVRSAIGRC